MRTVSAAAAAAALALSLSLAACSSTPPEPVSGTLAETTVTATATVEKIDVAARHVTVRDADGKSISIVCPPEVRNLAQVNVGDEVVVSYHESVAYEVKKAGEATSGVTVAATSGRAKPGERPAAGAGAATTVTVTIMAIDNATPSVTLRAPDGDLMVVKVKDRSKLERVAVGDLVEITYTEALAVSVQPKR